jgi:hypothetical protein
MPYWAHWVLDDTSRAWMPYWAPWELDYTSRTLDAIFSSLRMGLYKQRWQLQSPNAMSMVCERGGEGKRRILIGQSFPPTPIGMAFGRLKLSPLDPGYKLELTENWIMQAGPWIPHWAHWESGDIIRALDTILSLLRYGCYKKGPEGDPEVGIEWYHLSSLDGLDCEQRPWIQSLVHLLDWIVPTGQWILNFIHSLDWMITSNALDIIFSSLTVFDDTLRVLDAIFSWLTALDGALQSTLDPECHLWFTSWIG